MTEPIPRATFKSMTKVNYETYIQYLEHNIAKLDKDNEKKSIFCHRFRKRNNRVWLKAHLFGTMMKRRTVKVVRREVRLTWYNMFATATVEKWLEEAKLLIFKQNDIIGRLIDDIMEKEKWLAKHCLVADDITNQSKSPVDELCRVFGNIPEHYFGFVSIFSDFWPFSSLLSRLELFDHLLQPVPTFREKHCKPWVKSQKRPKPRRAVSKQSPLNR